MSATENYEMIGEASTMEASQCVWATFLRLIMANDPWVTWVISSAGWCRQQPNQQALHIVVYTFDRVFLNV